MKTIEEELAKTLSDYLHGNHRPDNVTPTEMLNTYNPGLLQALSQLIDQARLVARLVELDLLEQRINEENLPKDHWLNSYKLDRLEDLQNRLTKGESDGSK